MTKHITKAIQPIATLRLIFSLLVDAYSDSADRGSQMRSQRCNVYTNIKKGGKNKKNIKGKAEKMEGLEMGFGEDKGYKFLMLRLRK
jgi:hypothetical protein